MDTIQWLRKALNEMIPANGTEADTNFTDAELQGLLDENGGNKYKAVSEGWTLKAGLIEAGAIQSYNVGGESYTFEDKTKAYDRAMKLSEHYFKLARRGTSTMFSADASDEPASYSALLGGKIDAE